MESNASSPPPTRGNSSTRSHSACPLGSELTVAPTDSSTRTFCDIADTNAFSAGYDQPPLPVLAAFGSGRLHQYRMESACDLDRAVEENGRASIRSFRNRVRDTPSGNWQELLFKFGPKAFLHATAQRIVGYATTASEAERQAAKFSEKYRNPPTPSGGSFQLIKIARYDGIDTETVALDVSTILSDESLDLYFRDGFVEWHRYFSGVLPNSNYGLSIFEGAPGTGKTSYLRHLMGTLKESHRFYFIPTSSMGVLSDPKFIDFWSGQRHAHPGRKFVVILEDSDAAIMTRASDNREQVSAILNLSDGMLADFLRLQIICTINCTTADIDPALLRPGRLLCHRVFGRLDYSEASRLAEYLGRTLPCAGNYSLAEVFAGRESKDASRPQIGFAA